MQRVYAKNLVVSSFFPARGYSCAACISKKLVASSFFSCAQVLVCSMYKQKNWWRPVFPVCRIGCQHNTTQTCIASCLNNGGLRGGRRVSSQVIDLEEVAHTQSLRSFHTHAHDATQDRRRFLTVQLIPLMAAEARRVMDAGLVVDDVLPPDKSYNPLKQCLRA